MSCKRRVGSGCSLTPYAALANSVETASEEGGGDGQEGGQDSDWRGKVASVDFGKVKLARNLTSVPLPPTQYGKRGWEELEDDDDETELLQRPLSAKIAHRNPLPVPLLPHIVKRRSAKT